MFFSLTLYDQTNSECCMDIVLCIQRNVTILFSVLAFTADRISFTHTHTQHQVNTEQLCVGVRPFPGIHGYSEPLPPYAVPSNPASV